MNTLSAVVGPDGMLTVHGGPAPVRCYGWVDVDQDEALVLDGATRRSSSERGHRFEGIAELDQIRAVKVERLGDWTALLLPRGSRLLVSARLAVSGRPQAQPVASRPPLRMPEPPLPQDAPARQTARAVAGVVLALVLLDLFGR